MADFWYSLKCIRCGACMNTCPVYRRSGGLSYGATYSGPIGVIIDPTFNLRKYSSLPFASTLNGSCTQCVPGQDQHPRADLQVAADHRRAEPAADREAGSDAHRRQDPRQPQALPRGRGGGGRRRRTSAAFHDVQPAECVGPAARSARRRLRRRSASGTSRIGGRRTKEPTMSSRDEILARVRKNQPAAQPLPSLPSFDRGDQGAARDVQGQSAAHGRQVRRAPAAGDLTAVVRGLFPAAKVFCPATPEVAGNRAIERVRPPAELHDVDVGIVRAVYGVVETGSVWLTAREFKVEALGFLVAAPRRAPRPGGARRHHARRVPAAGGLRRPLWRLHDRTLGHRGHRGRPDPRRPGHPQPDGHSRPRA